MKRYFNKKLIASLLCVLTVIVSVLTVTVFADTPTDAMTAIKAEFEAEGKNLLVGSKVSVSDDGYIGIPVELTTYYDFATHGAAKAGYNGTPLMIYVVNTGVERIGAKTDVEIIKGMLDDGYIVAVLDYKNHAKAVSPDLDWSTQTIRKNIMNSKYFKDTSKVPSGTYYSNYIVPAGYDVSIRNVFWEADKHGADGTLEKIVENWNTDLRGWFSSSLRSKKTYVYWLDNENKPKSTQNGFDGSEPVWYADAEGKTVASPDTDSDNDGIPDGKYVHIQHTLAVDITDCVGKDGTPIDLNLYMDIVYPTTKEGSEIAPVPIAVLANSSEYLSTASTGSGLRPQHNGFLFNGYAGASFDYLYQPMAQSDYYGYYDGRTDQGALTGDRMNYGLHLYNDKRINTAAMRYLRYLTLTDPDTYSFDITSIGVFGNSKGGWFSYLGEEIVKKPATQAEGQTLAEAIDAKINSYTSKRMFEGSNGETRFGNNKTEAYTRNGITIDGGELQPWLTYTKDGVEYEIPSYASWTYASNGSQPEDVSKGHSPMFIALHLQDDFSTYSNAFAEVAGNLKDVPSYYVVVDLGHTFAYGPDWYRGFDTYQAMFDFAGYYLKGDAVKVVYTTPIDATGNVSTTKGITVKFSGAVPASEIEKVKVTAKSGAAATGSWDYVAGMTEWTFSPDALIPGEEYTITVPADIKGDNKKAMGAAYTATFYTEAETVADVTTVTTEKGTYLTFTAPSLASASDARVRFKVGNDAANIAGLYAVSGFDASNPDAATVGAKIGTVNLKGGGYYEIDASAVISAASGSELTLLLKAEKTESQNTTSASLSSISIGTYARKNDETKAPDGVTEAIGLYVNENIKANGQNQYPYEVFYNNGTTLFTASNLFTSSAITTADYGRKFTVSMRVYDTVSRLIQLSLTPAYTATNGVHDFDVERHNFKTVAGEWTTLTFDYVVYEPSYGDKALAKKVLTVLLGTTGASEKPVYIESINVTETVTDMSVSSASIVLGARDDAYKADTEGKPFTIGTTGYDSFAKALSAAKSGNTVKLNKNYTMTSSDNFSNWTALGNITVDLNGYKLYANGGYSPIVAKASSKTVATTNITFKNGSVYLYNKPLVSYSGSNAAGDGKVFNITFDTVNVLNAPGSRLYNVISDTAIDASSGADVNIAFVNSNIDFRVGMNTRHVMTVFPIGEGSLDLSYTMTGGSVYLDTTANLDIFTSIKKLELLKTSGGAYTTFSIPASVNVADLAIMRDDGIATFKNSGEASGIVTYTTDKSPLSTKYGIIPEAYADAQAYPFVLFDEKGTFKGAYNCWIGNSDNGAGGVFGAAKNYVVNPWDGTSYGYNPKEAFIVMRRNYTFDAAKDVKFVNLAQLQGTINVDLGGFTLSAGNVAYPIIPAFSKGFSGSESGIHVFPSTIVVNNGTLLNYKSGTVAMSTWDSAPNFTIANKHFNFIFNGVTFGFTNPVGCEGLVAHSWKKTGTPGAAAPFNFTYNDCTFDLTTTSGKATIFALSGVANNYIKLTAVVNGGKILANDPSKVKVIDGTTSEATYGSSVSFGKGSDGKMTYYSVPNTASVSIGSYNGTDGKILGFVESGAEGSNKIYTLVDNPLVTSYGTITSTYEDAEKYPFAVFTDTKVFRGAFALFSEAVHNAKGYSSSSDKTAYVLLRTDYTTKINNYNDPQNNNGKTKGDEYDNWAQVKGTVVIDLNDHTITQGDGASGIFAIVNSKGMDGTIFPSNYVVKNGTLLAGSNPILRAKMWTTKQSDGTTPIDMSEKLFTWDFNNVTFGFKSGATASNLLLGYESPQVTSNPKTAPFFFNYNDCTFDMTNAPSGAKLFNANAADSTMITSTVTVTGGEIKNAASLSLAQLYSLNSTNTNGSSVTFKKNADGDYTKIYIAEGGAAPSGDVPTEDGALIYVKTATDSGYVLYTLTNLTTKYGAIPADKASIQDYPFILFKKVGNAYTYVKAYSIMYGAQSGGVFNGALYDVLKPNVWDPAEKTYGENAATAIILLRRDYTMGADEYHNNLAQAQGTIIFDLDGNSLYQNTASTKSFFNYTSKGWKDSGDEKIFDSSFIVKNGSFYMYKGSLLNTHCWDSIGNNTIADKMTSWQFDNVKFALIKGATAANLINTPDAPDSTTGIAPIDLIFNDCVFDLKTVAPTSAITVFNNSNTADKYIKMNIVVNGGTILTNSLTNITLTTLDTTYGSAFSFGKGSEGKYVVLETSSLPDVTEYPTTEGAATFTETSDNVYELALSTVTKYGNIPARYASEETYPLVVFLDGKFVFATDKIGVDAKDSAFHRAKTNGSVILLRRNYTFTGPKYQNLSQTNGAITFDLGGFTISCEQTGDYPLFFAQKKTAYDSTVTVINGTILTAKNPIVTFSAWAGSSGSYTGGKQFNISFEDVTLGAVAGTKPAVLIASASENLSEPKTPCALTLTDCTIDLTGLTDTTVFNIKDASSIICVTLTVNGGKIIGDDVSAISFALTAGESTALFDTSLKLYAKSGTNAIFTTAEGRYAFNPQGTEGEYTVYELIPEAYATFVPKTSVTLWSNFVYNIYLPVRDGITAINVGSESYTASELPTETISGTSYYKIAYAINVMKAAESFEFKVTLGDRSASWTLGITSYAKTVIDGEAYSAEEKALMKDMLSYIREAYSYFNITSDDIADINTIIPESYDEENLPDMTKTQKTPEGSGFKNVTLDLGEAPAYRFYYDGETAPAYTFTVGGVEITSENGTDSHGKYLEVKVYAYMMLLDVSFGAEGEEPFVYNVYSYYNWASANGEAKAAELVERLVKYCESANAYRNTMIPETN